MIRKQRRDIEVIALARVLLYSVCDPNAHAIVDSIAQVKQIGYATRLDSTSPEHIGEALAESRP